MGLSVHYSGKLKSYELVNVFTSEVRDICESMNWRYSVMHAHKSKSKPGGSHKKYKPGDLKGICFTPDECETFSLTFLPDASLCCPAKLIFHDPPNEDMMVEVISVKTQFAGVQTHMAVLKLLHYLKEKYFESFELDDEGEYWEIWDESRLQYRFNIYNTLIDSVAEALGDISLIPGESNESLLTRIEAILSKKLSGGKK